MYSYEEIPTEGSKLARGIAKVSAIIGGTMLAASCSTLVIREVDKLSVDPRTPYENPIQTIQTDYLDSTIEYTAQTGLAALGVAVAALTVNSVIHAYQRRSQSS